MSAPLDWVKHVDEALLALEEKPQFGTVPSLNWQHLEKTLQTVFEKPNLKLSHNSKGWTSFEKVFEGIGKDQQILAFSLSPVEETGFFVTSLADIQRLMTALLDGGEMASFFQEKKLAVPFLEYFAAEIMSALEVLKFAYPLAFRLAEDTKLEKEAHFEIEVSLSVNGGTFWGKILIPDSFRKAFKRYFANAPREGLSKELREKLPVDLALEVGMTDLTLQEWQSVKTGDFILLDLCSYDPDKKKGMVVLTVGQKPLFRGRFKEDGVKITNYSVYEEEIGGGSGMQKEFEDEDLYGNEEEGLFKDLEEEKEPTKPAKEAGETASRISPKDLPVHLSVEVGRLRMTADELMNLVPGNLLELNMKPEQGVDLVVNGKKVGRGELIRMGELLGVRILSL